MHNAILDDSNNAVPSLHSKVVAETLNAHA